MQNIEYVEYIGAVKFDGNDKEYFFTTIHDRLEQGDRVVVDLKNGRLETATFVRYAPILGEMPPCYILEILGD